MKRFFVEQDLKSGAVLQLSREESKHALRVMRLQVGEEVLLTNGKGIQAKARLISTSSEAELEILSIHESPELNRPKITLIQGVLKGPKMDWLVEKATELGIHFISPITTQYSVALEGKEDRWKRIVQAAMKQSGNAIAPEIEPLKSLKEVLQEVSSKKSWKFILSPQADTSLLEQLQNLKKITELSPQTSIILAIGPEGGFSEEEEKAFYNAGFAPACLSKNILRGETAAISAIAILAHTIDFT